MSIRKKGRRKIVCGYKHYIWYVEEDYDSPHYLLRIASEDKSIIVVCPLEMKIPYIITMGKRFQGKEMDGKYHRLLLPFDVPKIITPGFVARLIEWVEHGEPTEEIKWNWNWDWDWIKCGVSMDEVKRNWHTFPV